MSQIGIRRPRLSLGRGPGIVAFLLVIGLLLAMAIEPARQLLAQRERVDSMGSDLAKIERLNDRLEKRIDRLKDPDFIEQQARSIGLVHPGEIPYVVMPPSDGTRSEESGPQKKPEPAPPPDPGVVESFLDFIGFL